MKPLPASDVPLLPEYFRGRQVIIEPICARLRQPEFLSSQVVGGPRSGKTSLLRFLASEYADEILGPIAHVIRVDVDAAPLGPEATPFQFWTLVFRELKKSADWSAVAAEHLEIAPLLEKALYCCDAHTLDIFHLQDLFDAFAAARRPVVLLVDEFDAVVANTHFLPPSPFLDQVRNLCNRVPRGVAFVAATTRPLSDVSATAAGPSPPYNHFATIYLTPMSGEDVRVLMAWMAQLREVVLPENAWSEVLQASLGRPSLVTSLACRWVDAASRGADFGPPQLREIIADPDGPFIRLSRSLLASLTARERQAIDAWTKGPAEITENQRSLLKRLQVYSLLPPGIAP